MNYFFQSKLVRTGTNKRFWRLWTPLSIIGFIAIYLAFMLLKQVVSERLDQRILASSEIVQDQIKEQFDRVYENIDFIARSQVTKNFLNTPGNVSSFEQINLMFLNIASTYKVYDQIRLLSPNGDELVRVNFNNGNPQAVQPNALQNKADRYYFNHAVNLAADKVFVSKLDLNVERGEIETPYKPVIRFAKPIYGENHELKAVLVFNYIGDIILNGFRSVLSSIPGKRMLINDDGYWLSSDDRSKEWGFMLDNQQSFKIAEPTLWEEMSSTRSGIIDADIGRVRYFSIDPRSDRHATAAPLEGELGPWKMVVVNGEHRMGLSFLFEHMAYLYPLLLAYPLGSILIWFWARADSGRAVAEQELVALNRSLERKVHQRTAELEATKDAAILSLATLAETRDNETGQHVHRTQRFVEVLAKELQHHPDFSSQLTHSAIEQIYKSAPLHDVGKVGIPDEILHKPGKLDESEFTVMKRHTTLGSDAIEEAINSLSASLALEGTGTFLHYARDIAHYHHERWDGSGYPKGLQGDGIPLAARIMAVADVYDALVSERVYKKAFSREKAEEIIINQSHGQFDPRIIEAFKQVRDQFWEIKLFYSDHS